MPVDHSEILQALKDRQKWEDRQATWYKMRHDGLRRVNKPYPGAADMHFPLGDMQIEKLKPFYLSQIYATDTVCSFISRSPQHQSIAQEAALWFDGLLKHDSNFEDQIAIAVDKMLNCAVVPVKVFHDPDRQRLAFEAINPIHLIVPPHTGRLAEADWIVHIQRYSKHAYARIKEFDQGPELMAAIAGSESKEAASTYTDAKLQREGITTTADKNQIIVWEKYSRDEGGQWLVETYSPAAPNLPIRPPFRLPFNAGVFAEPLPPPPFFELTMERKDSGYYDPRGVMERLAPFEASLCKDWNTLKDWQTQSSNLTYTAPKGIPANNGTLRHVPGQIYPFEIQALTIPPSPVDMGASMQSTRLVAEQLIGAPDFGTGQQNGRDQKTAREVNLIASVMGQSTDLRARQFRRELGQGLRMAWAIALQYCSQKRSYRTLEGFAELSADIFAADWQIELNASGDNWNRQQVIQQAQALLQMFRGDPFINQEELRRDVLNAIDPRRTKTLLLNAGTQNAMQMEDQAQEISIMLLGFPAEVRESDHHILHLQSLQGFLQRRLALGEAITPETVVMIAQHAGAHAQAAAKTQKDQWQQAGPQLQPFLQQLGAAAQQAQVALQAQAQAAQQAQALAAQAQAAAPAVSPRPVGPGRAPMPAPAALAPAAPQPFAAR